MKTDYQILIIGLVGFILLVLLTSTSNATMLNVRDYYSLDGNTNDYFNIVNATNTGGVTYVNAFLNNGTSYDKTSGMYTNFSTNAFPFTDVTSFTINLWVNKSDQADGTLFCGNNAGGIANYTRIQENLGKYGLEFWDGAANPKCQSNNSWAFNKTVMITLVVDRPTQNAIMYINGTENCRVNISALKPGLNYANWRMGARWDGSEQVTAVMDEVTIYTYALNATNISTLYNSGVPLNMNTTGGSSPTYTNNFVINSNTYGSYSLSGYNATIQYNGTITNFGTVTKQINTTLYNGSRTANVTIYASNTNNILLNFTLFNYDLSNNLTFNYTVFNLTVSNGTSNLNSQILINSTNTTLNINQTATTNQTYYFFQPLMKSQIVKIFLRGKLEIQMVLISNR